MAFAKLCLLPTGAQSLVSSRRAKRAECNVCAYVLCEGSLYTDYGVVAIVMDEGRNVPRPGLGKLRWTLDLGYLASLRFAIR